MIKLLEHETVITQLRNIPATNTEASKKTEILYLDEFKEYGKPSKIAKLFGGKSGYLKAVRELEEEIYHVG